VSLRKRPGGGVEKTTNGVRPSKRLKTDYITHKELQRIRKVADGHHDSALSTTDAAYDPWATPVVKQTQSTDPRMDSFLQATINPPPPKAPGTLRKAPISLAANGKPVPAVPKPRGGYSYNPSFIEYEARFLEAGDRAVEAEQKRLAEAEADRLKMEAAARSAAEAEAAEVRAEQSGWEEESEWEGIESGGEGLAIKTKRPQRKTQAQRNKIKRRKEAEQLARHEAAMKRKLVELDRVKAIARGLVEREREAALEKVEMSDGSTEGNEELLRRRQLGKYRLPEKDLELVLPDELQDSLRLLKPEGNLLKDRYRSLLVRGKMETRKHIPFKKQAKVKAVEKWTFKDFELF
jgi:nucleolar protein 53